MAFNAYVLSSHSDRIAELATDWEASPVPVTLDECVGAYISTLPAEVRGVVDVGVVLRALNQAVSEDEFCEILGRNRVRLDDVGDHLAMLYAPKDILLTHQEIESGMPAVRIRTGSRVFRGVYACVKIKEKDGSLPDPPKHSF